MEVIIILVIAATYALIDKYLQTKSDTKDWREFKERTITQMQNLEEQTNAIRNRLDELEH